jgi:hypothetical protein
MYAGYHEDVSDGVRGDQIVRATTYKVFLRRLLELLCRLCTSIVVCKKLASTLVQPPTLDVPADREFDNKVAASMVKYLAYRMLKDVYTRARCRTK